MAVKLSSLNKGLILDMPLKSRFEKVGDELVTDGSFENWNSSTDLANWSESGYDGNVRKVSQESTEVHSGAYSVKLQATNNDGTSDFRVYQYLNTTIGRIYKVVVHTYYASRTQGSVIITIEDSSNNVIGALGITDQESGWTKHIFYFTSNDNTVRFSLWLSDETTGTVYFDSVSVKEVKTSDLTPNQNHGIIYGATVEEDYTSFDGSDDKIVIDNSPILNPTSQVTVSVWAKAAEENMGAAILVNKYNTYPGTYTLYSDATTGKIGWHVRLEGSESTQRKVLSNSTYDTNWHHYVGVYDGNTVKLYVDSVLQDDTYSISGTIDTDNQDYLGIGYRPNEEDQFWNGQICNVKIWNRALSETEIKQLYYQGKEGGKIKI